MLHQTALTLSMLHPNVATLDPTAAAATKSLLNSKNTRRRREPAVAHQWAGYYIAEDAKQSQHWRHARQGDERRRRSRQITIPILQPGHPNPPKVVGYNNTGFSTLQFSDYASTRLRRLGLLPRR